MLFHTNKTLASASEFLSYKTLMIIDHQDLKKKVRWLLFSAQLARCLNCCCRNYDDNGGGDDDDDDEHRAIVLWYGAAWAVPEPGKLKQRGTKNMARHGFSILCCLSLPMPGKLNQRRMIKQTMAQYVVVSYCANWACPVRAISGNTVCSNNGAVCTIVLSYSAAWRLSGPVTLKQHKTLAIMLWRCCRGKHANDTIIKCR